MGFNPGAGKTIPRGRNRQERIKYPIEFKLTHFNKVIIDNLRIRTSKTRFHGFQHSIYLKCACLMFHLHSGKKKYLHLQGLTKCLCGFPTIGLL